MLFLVTKLIYMYMLISIGLTGSKPKWERAILFTDLLYADAYNF